MLTFLRGFCWWDPWHTIAAPWIRHGIWTIIGNHWKIWEIRISISIYLIFYLKYLKHVRCNPDAAPHLTSGGYEDKVDVITCYYPNQNTAHRGWRILIPYEDKVDVITPINILFIGGGKFWFLMKIKLMLLPQSTYCSYGVANFW